jgi:hypothetical protein
MAFSDFQYPDVVGVFGLAEHTVPDLFAGVSPVAPGPVLAATLPLNIRLATSAHSEASRSIWMVGPVLSDLWNRYAGEVCLIAGADFPADPAAKLTGYCDFVIGRGPQRAVIGAPLLLIFEAKRDSIPDGLGQCIAGMVGAQRFNRRNNNPIDPVYGCITTGTNWKFLRLSGTNLTQDLTEYTLSQVDRILGIMIHMIGPVPQHAAA